MASPRRLLLPTGESPPIVRRITGERLTTDEVEQVLAMTLESTLTRGEAVDDSFRGSLAGAQEKTALLLRNGVWHRPT